MDATATPAERWDFAIKVYDRFVADHPCLNLSPGKWGYHNFLRRHRSALAEADAIRLANNKHLIAHPPRFYEVAFRALTRNPSRGVTA